MDENILNIVRLFKSELELIREVLLYRINHSSYDKLDEKRKSKYEDLLMHLSTGLIITEIRNEDIPF